MNSFDFKSQIATSRSQSERLIALGLKPETADMTHHYMYSTDGYELKDVEFSRIMHLRELVNKKPVLGRSGDDMYAKDIPAWSLHRLIEMMPQIIGHLELAINDAFVGYYEDRCESETGMYWEHTEESSNLYDNIISTIEWLVNEGYFNKEYLI